MAAPIFSWEMTRLGRGVWFRNLRRLYSAIVLFFFLWYLFQIYAFLDQYRGGLSGSVFLWLTGEYAGFVELTHGFAVALMTPIFAVLPMLREKQTRTLDLLLATHQRAGGIVLGHWFSACAKIVILTTPSIPLILFLDSLFGTPWWTSVLWIACSYLFALPIAAWGILGAIWMRRSASALLVGFLGVGLMLGWFVIFFETARWRSMTHAIADMEFWLLFAATIAPPTLLFLGVAVWRLRPTYLDQRDSLHPVPGGRAPIGDEPIFWKLHHCDELSSFHWLRRVPFWARLSAFVVMTCLIPAVLFKLGPTISVWAGILILIAFPLAALVWAAGCVSGEREAGTWDPLRLTNLRADEFAEQTLRAISRRVRAYWLATIPAAILLTSTGREAGLFIPLAWLVAGLWIQHSARVGLRFSVAMDSPTASIFRALTDFVARVFVFACLTFDVVIVILIIVIISDLEIPDRVAAVAGLVPLAWWLIIMQLVFRRISTEDLRITIHRLNTKEGLDGATPENAERNV